MTRDDVVDLLIKRMAGASGYAFAKANKLSDTDINCVLSGRKAPGPTLLEFLGLEKVTIYRRKP